MRYGLAGWLAGRHFFGAPCYHGGRVQMTIRRTDTNDSILSSCHRSLTLDVMIRETLPHRWSDDDQRHRGAATWLSINICWKAHDVLVCIYQRVCMALPLVAA
jgi:hypothetical protein